MAVFAGYQDVETIIVLGDETAVDKFRSSHLGTAVDIDMIAGRNSSVIQKDEQLHALSTCVPFSIAGGACLDFSFKGASSTDEAPLLLPVCPSKLLDCFAFRKQLAIGLMTYFAMLWTRLSWR